MNPLRTALMVLIWLVSSSAVAQQFSIHLQGGTAPGSFGGRGQLEASFALSPGLSVGARLNLLSAPLGGVLEISLSPLMLYRVFIYGDGVWSFSGYGGAQLGVFYAPNRSAAVSQGGRDDSGGGSDGSGSGSSGNSGSGRSGTASQNSGNGDDDNAKSDDDRRGGRSPRGDDNFNSTQPLEFTALGLSGVDGAYFVNERVSLYFGLEVDLRLLPILEPVAYPYAEVDYLLLDNLTVAVGAYLGLRATGATYLIYGNLFYGLTQALGVRLEVAFDGAVSGYVRLTIRL